MALMGIPKFERRFRAAARLDIDKNARTRYRDVVHQQLHGLPVMGAATAKANSRGVLEPTTCRSPPASRSAPTSSAS